MFAHSQAFSFPQINLLHSYSTNTVSDFESLRSLLHPKTPSLFLLLYQLHTILVRARTNMDTHSGKTSATEQIHPITGDTKALPSSNSSPLHTAPEVIGIGDGAEGENAGENADETQARKGGWFAYLKTRNFYIVLLLGYGVIIISISPEGAISYAEMCATQAGPGPLHHGHQYILFAPCGPTLLHSCIPDFVELYPSYAGLWLVHNLQIWLQGMDQAHA